MREARVQGGAHPNLHATAARGHGGLGQRGELSYRMRRGSVCSARLSIAQAVGVVVVMHVLDRAHDGVTATRHDGVVVAHASRQHGAVL